jgi:ParB family chromosome partitioning protein
MSVKDKLAARFGGNVMESMGAGGAPAGFGMPAPAVPRETAKFVGCVRAKLAILIETGRIVPDPNQPRKEFDEESLEQLAGSLKERGQLQPIRVRWDDQMERWVIIAGERRWRAAVRAGIPQIAAVEASGPMTEDEILEDQLIENCLREDLRPIEQARAYKALMATRGLSVRQLGERLRIGHGTIAKAVALLNLPGDIQEAVDSGAIAAGTAYQLTKVGDAVEQAELAKEAAAGRLKRDEVEDRTRRPREGREGKGRPWTFATARGKVSVAALAEDFSEADLIELLRAALAECRKKSRSNAA